MGLGRIVLLVFLPLLVACKVLPDGGGAAALPPPEGNSSVVQGEAESSPPSGAARPKPRPGSIEQGPEAVAPEVPAQTGGEPLATTAPEPSVFISKEQTTCEKRGGTWGTAGKSGGKTCIKRTRDAGKQCRKKSSCEGVCLARSGTCAPVSPLFGCNEILQNDGSRVTLCVD